MDSGPILYEPLIVLVRKDRIYYYMCLGLKENRCACKGSTNIQGHSCMKSFNIK